MSRTCPHDTDGDGNCAFHRDGCPATVEQPAPRALRP